MKKILLLLFATTALTSLILIIAETRRGCCSWHGGVCGCSNGRAICCDGKPSPTCGCD